MQVLITLPLVLMVRQFIIKFDSLKMLLDGSEGFKFLKGFNLFIFKSIQLLLEPNLGCFIGFNFSFV